MIGKQVFSFSPMTKIHNMTLQEGNWSFLSLLNKQFWVWKMNYFTFVRSTRDRCNETPSGGIVYLLNPALSFWALVKINEEWKVETEVLPFCSLSIAQHFQQKLITDRTRVNTESNDLQLFSNFLSLSSMLSPSSFTFHKNVSLASLAWHGSCKRHCSFY